MLENLRISAVVTVALAALTALLALPAALTAETETRPAEKASEPSPKVNKKTQRSNLQKLALEKLTLEKTVSEKPALEEPPPPQEPVPGQAPDANQGSDNPESTVRAGVASVPVLPGPSRKAPAKRPPATAPPTAKQAPPGNGLLLSVPRLGLENVPVGDSSKQSYLDREGIIHLSGTGFPYERGSNTYIAGHAGDYNASRIPNVFHDLRNIRHGDLVTLRDTTGRTYNYRVYKGFIVDPRDVWVTRPVRDKQIVSLQTCFPAPTFEKRLIIRAELVN